MTARGAIAIFLGIVCACILAAITHHNDWIIGSTFLIGNFLPIAVFGGLVIFLLLINGTLRSISPSISLNGRQLAVIVALSFFASTVPASGLLRYFTTTLMMPHHHVKTEAGWQGTPEQFQRDSVRDWPALAAALGNTDGDRIAARAHVCEMVRSRLPDEAWAPAGLSNHDAGAQSAVISALNAVLDDPDLQNAAGLEELNLSWATRILLERNPEQLTPTDLRRLNRGLLDAALAGIVEPRKVGVMENLPTQMLAEPGIDTTTAVDGFVTGLAEGDKTIGYRDVPWQAWDGTLLFWLPVIFMMYVIVISASLIVHQQWAHHEHLPYPTVEFARSLLPQEGGASESIFRNKLFWIGLVPVLLIYLNNYINLWWPKSVIPIPTRFNCVPLLGIFPIFWGHMWWALFNPTIFFIVVGFTYFLAKDVALSIGISPFVFSLLTGMLQRYGISLGGSGLAPSRWSFLNVGIYFGMFVSMLHTGRRYYLSVLRRSLFLPSCDSVQPHAVIGARVFIVAVAGMVLLLMQAGLDWQLGVLFVFCSLVIFVVLARLLAEAGYFFVGWAFFPWTIMMGFMGAKALGSNQLLLLMMLSTILIVPRETLMPFAVAGLCLADRAKAKVGTTAVWGAVAIAAALAVGVPVVLRLQYQHGVTTSGDWWSNGSKPREAFWSNLDVRNALEAQGTLEESDRISGWQRLAAVRPDRSSMITFALSFGAVLLFMFLRHRFPAWPFHPLMLVTMSMWSASVFSFSILLGWLIKTLVMKYGGATLYQKLKPLMIGLIAGEMLGIIVPVIVGAIYFAVTGEPPKVFHVLPR